MMHPGNNLFASLVAVALLLLGLCGGAAHAGMTTDQIKGTVESALSVLKDPRLKPAAKTKERRDQLRQILFTRFDFAEMAKRALGANWRRRTPQEQEEFVQLFSDVLERAYAGIIESYTDEKIVYLSERVEGGFADVGSKIITARGEEFSIFYKAHRVGNDWKIYDVVAENISLVNNYRSQFNRVIAKSSYEELLRRLRDKSEFASAPKN
jgi:phospholipid transport system substrate-binding protein